MNKPMLDNYKKALKTLDEAMEIEILMKTPLFSILFLFSISIDTYASSMESDSKHQFEKIVLSKNVKAECDAQQGDERGPFGIIYSEGALTHTFLVITGVYYDTCKSLEMKINNLKRKEAKIILLGTTSNLQKEKNEKTWRWAAVKSLLRFQNLYHSQPTDHFLLP